MSADSPEAETSERCTHHAVLRLETVMPNQPLQPTEVGMMQLIQILGKLACVERRALLKAVTALYSDDEMPF